MSGRRMLLFHLLVLFLAPSAVWISRAASADTPVRVTALEPPRLWPSRFAAPLWLSVENGRDGQELRFSLSSTWWRLQETVRLHGTGRQLISGAMVEQGMTELAWSVGSEMGRKWLSPPASAGTWTGHAWVLTPDNRLFRDLLERDADIDQPYSQSIVRADSIQTSQLPTRWQQYAGFYGTILLTPETIAALGSERRQALREAILWLGARVWLVRGDIREACQALGLDEPAGRPDDYPDGIRRYRVGNGDIVTMAEWSAAAFLRRVSTTEPGDMLAGMYEGRQYDGGAVFTNLAGISTTFIMVCLLVLGLLLGPVNYLYTRRGRNPLLFFIITPVTALVGGGLILVGATVLEGSGARYNEYAMLVARAGASDAMLLDSRSVRTGMWLPSLRFSPDTLLVPAAQGDYQEQYGVELTDGVRPLDGWFRPRATSAYNAATPAVARFGITARRDGNGWLVENGLDHDILSAILWTDTGEAHTVGGVTVGESAHAQPGSGERALTGYTRETFLSQIGFTGKRDRVRLVAECRGLPYIDDGGLGGGRREGRYHYVLLDDSLEAAQ